MGIGRIEIDQEALADLCRRFSVRRLSVFGSLVDGDFGQDSDVDLLVSFEPGSLVGLVAMIELRDQLEGLFGRKVDLVEEEGLKRRIRKRVLSSARPLYVAA